MVAQRISAEDIVFITETIVPLLEGAIGDDAAGLDRLTAILSPELVKVLQVLGFNYRRAIGEPLTELVAGLIRSKQMQAEVTGLDKMRHESLIFQLALDADATARFERLTGRIPPSPFGPPGAS
jgi:hypothetical protein